MKVDFYLEKAVHTNLDFLCRYDKCYTMMYFIRKKQAIEYIAENIYKIINSKKKRTIVYYFLGDHPFLLVEKEKEHRNIIFNMVLHSPKFLVIELLEYLIKNSFYAQMYFKTEESPYAKAMHRILTSEYDVDYLTIHQTIDILFYEVFNNLLMLILFTDWFGVRLLLSTEKYPPRDSSRLINKIVLRVHKEIMEKQNEKTKYNI